MKKIIVLTFIIIVSKFSFAEFQNSHKIITDSKNSINLTLQNDEFNKLSVENKALEKIKKYYAGDDQIVAAVLAWFLGAWGIHRFYLGYTGIGILQLILGLSIIGLFITIPWALIDFIMIILGKLQPNGGFYVNSI